MDRPAASTAIPPPSTRRRSTSASRSTRAPRRAAAGVIYLRGKLARELDTASRQLAGLCRCGSRSPSTATTTPLALTLITRRDALRDEVERLTAELTELTTRGRRAKQNLIAFQDDIARLRDEKVRMLARLANARARIRLQQTLSGVSTDADLRALDAVREHIERQVAEVQLGRDLGDADLEQRLGAIRDAEASASARAQLEEMKRSRPRRLLPVVLPAAQAAS